MHRGEGNSSDPESEIRVFDRAGKGRREEFGGIAPEPDGLWTEQVARNLVDEFAGFLRGKTHLIHDRDPLFTKAFRGILKSGGVASVRLPPKSPNLNAYAERFVLSIKSECLDRMVLVGERHAARSTNTWTTITASGRTRGRATG